jgi:hypothetical protein
VSVEVGQIVVANRRAVEYPAPLEIERDEWRVLQVEFNGRVLVEARNMLNTHGQRHRVVVKRHFLCTPEERVAEELMA